MCNLKSIVSPALVLLTLSFSGVAGAKIDVAKSELNLLEGDLLKIREPERKIARIDQTLLALLSRTNSIGEPIQAALHLRHLACENVAKKNCPPTPNLSKELCSDSRSHTFATLDIWSDVLPVSMWQTTLDSCSAEASVGQALGGLAAFSRFAKTQNGTEAVAALEWSQIKFAKLKASKRDSVVNLLKDLPGGRAAAKQVPSPQPLIDLIPATTLAGVYADSNFEILVRYPNTVRKIAQTLQFSVNGDPGKSLSTLVYLGYYEAADTLYQASKGKLNHKWDTYRYCLLKRLSGKLDEAIACTSPHPQEEWFQYEKFDALILSGKSNLAREVLAHLSGWKSPYLMLAKVQAGERLSPEDVANAASMVTKEYPFGFYLLGQNLSAAGFTPEQIAQMKADFKRSFSNRFLGQNFDQRKPLEAIATSLGKFHIFSRSVAYRFQAKP